MSNKQYNGLYVNQIKDAIRLVADTHHFDFQEIRDYVVNLSIERSIQSNIAICKEHKISRRHFIIAYFDEKEQEVCCTDGIVFGGAYKFAVVNDGPKISTYPSIEHMMRHYNDIGSHVTLEWIDV